MFGAESVQVNIWWLVLTGFFGGLGLAAWKFVPWAVKQGLQDVIDQKVYPAIVAVTREIKTELVLLDGKVQDVHDATNKVNERIDSHMDQEESSLGSMRDDMNRIDQRDGERVHALQVLTDQLGEHLLEAKTGFSRLDVVEAKVEILQSVLGKT